MTTEQSIDAGFVARYPESKSKISLATPGMSAVDIRRSNDGSWFWSVLSGDWYISLIGGGYATSADAERDAREIGESSVRVADVGRDLRATREQVQVPLRPRVCVRTDDGDVSGPYGVVVAELHRRGFRVRRGGTYRTAA